MRTLKKIMVAMAMLLTVTSYAQQATSVADVPKTISYQGMVTAPDGTPIADGQYNITVTFYADANGTNTVWQGTYPASITKGIYNILLGSGSSPFTSTGIFNQPLWVGVKVGEGEEMRPLTELSSAPSALGIADSSVTSSKMATPYVAGITVNGTPITGVGSRVNLVGAGSTSLLYDQQTNSIIVNAAGASAGTGDTANKSGSFKGNGGDRTMNVITTSGGVPQGIPVFDPSLADNITVSSLTDPNTSLSTLTTTDQYINISNSTYTPGYEINAYIALWNPGSENIFAGVAGPTTTLPPPSGGSNNTGVGYEAMFHVSGSEEVAVGQQALDSGAINGGSNTAVGSCALQGNTSQENTAIGYSTMKPAGAGTHGTAIGAYAMANNTSGDWNTSLGWGAMDSNTTGHHNVAAGMKAGYNNTTGAYNTAIGENALLTNQTGTSLTAIGPGADVSADGFTDALAIGANAIVPGSYCIQLGDKSITNVTTAGAITTGMDQIPPGAAGEIIFNDGGAGHKSTFTIAPLQTGNFNYTLPHNQQAGDMTDNGSGTLSWTAVTPGSLSSVTATSPVYSSGGTNPNVSIAPGLNNTFLTTDNLGVVGFNALDVDGMTLQGDGSSSALAINLGHANTWTTTQTFTPTTNVTGAVVRQTSAGSPMADIFDVQNNAGSTTYLDVNSAGNVVIPAFTTAGIVHNSASTGILTSSLVSMTADVTGILPIAKGGTNSGTALSGSSIIISNGSAIIQGQKGTTTTVLHGNASGAPSYGFVNLTSDVSNTLPVGNGGTGLTSTPSNGQLLIGNGSGYTLSTLTAGTGGVTVVNGGGSITISIPNPATGGVNTDATLTGDGVVSNLGINLGNADTWKNTMTISPSAGNNAQALIVNQTSYSGMPSTDIMDVNARSGAAMTVDKMGNFKIGSSTGPTNSHIITDGKNGAETKLNGGIINAGSAGNDIAGLVKIKGGGIAGDQLWIATQGSYAGGTAVVVIVSGVDGPSAGLEPYGYFNPNAGGPGVPGIVISTDGAPGAGTQYSFAYHVIHLQ